MSKIANLKGIGRKQRIMIEALYGGKKFISVMTDCDAQEHEITLSDDDGNDYCNVSPILLQSLLDRKIIFEFQSIEQSLGLIFTRYKLNEFITLNF